MSQNSIQVFLSSWSILKHFDSLWIVSTMRPKASRCDLLKRPSLLVAYVGSVDAGLHRRHNPWPARNLKPSPFGMPGVRGAPGLLGILSGNIWEYLNIPIIQRLFSLETDLYRFHTRWNRSDAGAWYFQLYSRLSSLIPSGNGQVPILRVTFSVRPDLLLLTRCLKPRSNSAENVLFWLKGLRHDTIRRRTTMTTMLSKCWANVYFQVRTQCKDAWGKTRPSPHWSHPDADSVLSLIDSFFTVSLFHFIWRNEKRETPTEELTKTSWLSCIAQVLRPFSAWCPFCSCQWSS